MTLRRDPEKIKAWRERSKGLRRSGGIKRTGRLKSRGTSKRARERQAEKCGPQHALSKEMACAACFVEDCRARGVDVDWGALPRLWPGQVLSDGHHEHSRTTGGCDAECMPLGTSKIRGGCGHHEERERVGQARFWGWRRLATGVWEWVGGGLDICPSGCLEEMRRRVREAAS